MFYAIGTSGGNQGLQRLAPTREKADQLLDERMKAPFTADANDLLYQWDSSRDYNPWPGLEKIKAALLAVNADDDDVIGFSVSGAGFDAAEVELRESLRERKREREEVCS